MKFVLFLNATFYWKAEKQDWTLVCVHEKHNLAYVYEHINTCVSLGDIFGIGRQKHTQYTAQ